MLSRPLLLRLFILFLICDPVLRTVFIAIEKDFSLLEVLNKTFSLSYLDIFNYWFLSPLSGFLLWFVNLPSLLLYIIAQLYSFYFHINYESYSWPYLSKTPSLTAYALLAINFLIMIYLLLPGSIELFKNKALRWWERGSRYLLDTSCLILINGSMIKGTVKDISFSGASLIIDEGLNLNSEFKLDLEIFNKSYILDGKIAREISSKDSYHYGVKFEFKSYFDQLIFKVLMLKINTSGLYKKLR